MGNLLKQNLPPPATQPIKGKDLRYMCDLDTATMKRSLREEKRVLKQEKLSHGPEDVRVFSFNPSYEQIHWHLTREEYKATALSKTIPQIKGAMVGQSAWMYWSHDFSANELQIMRIAVPNLDLDSESKLDLESSNELEVSYVTSLLHAAIAEAQECGLSKVVLWNPSIVTKSALLVLDKAYSMNLLTVHIEWAKDHIPSMRWKGGEASKVKETEWHSNQYYGWC